MCNAGVRGARNLAKSGVVTMSSENMSKAFGWRVYGLGMAAMGVLALVLGDLLSSQEVPDGFPGRKALAYAVAVFVTVAGAAVLWRRTTTWAAAALAAYFGLVVVVLMDGRLLLTGYASYGIYEELAEPLAMAAAGLIVYAASADIEAALAARLIRIGQIVFGICAVIFGGAHFAYMNLTAPLVPKWLPPSQVFWGCATGVGQIAAGIAILTTVQARLAAILLTAMYASFIPLVFVPVLLADPSNDFRWDEAVATLALTGVAWVMVDSFARRQALS
jgi:uncharacterized membrane protein